MDFVIVFVDAANPLAVKVSSAAGWFHGITRYFHIFAFPAGNLSYGKHDKKGSKNNERRPPFECENVCG